MHSIIFVISIIPGSSRQIILDILQQALLELGTEGRIMQGHAKAAVISHQNTNENIFKSVTLNKKTRKSERNIQE